MRAPSALKPSSLLLPLLPLIFVACGSGGDDSPAAGTAPQPSPPPAAQPDMLTATSQGILRGKANGQGQRLILARPNLHQPAFSGDVFLANGLVYYPREAPPVLFDYPNQDIWSVNTDGSGDHAVLNTGSDEFVTGVNPSYAIYNRGTYGGPNGRDDEWWSLRHNAGHALLTTERFAQYRFLAGDRAVFNTEHQLFSVNLNGSDARTHATADNAGGTLMLEASAVADGAVVFREHDFARATVKAVPLSGGSVVSLDDGQAYASYADHVGARVVTQRCAIVLNDEGRPVAGPCDVVSVNTDGSGPVTLVSHPANEAVQGIVGNQVMIRRNLSGNDQLIAVPVTGGAERLIMTMTDSEFVQLTTDDLLVIRRPSGTWTLDLNGTLKQIGIVNGEFGFIVVGNAYCLTRSGAPWCMPLDGQGQAVKIAETGRVLGAL